MKIFSLYINKKGDIKAIPSLSYNLNSPFFLSFIWLFFNVNNLLFLIISAFSALSILIIAPVIGIGGFTAFLLLHFAIAFLSVHILQLSCFLQGYEFVDITLANNSDEAILILMNRQSRLNVTN